MRAAARAAAAALALVGLAACAGGPEESERTASVALAEPTAPEPAPATLTGTLLFTTADGCRVQSLHLGDGSLGASGPATGCALWLSPSGDEAVVADSVSGASSGRAIWLLAVGDPSSLVRRLGVARGDVGWSPDGDSVAFCAEDLGTVVLTVASGATERLDGCNPRFTPSGMILTRSEDPERRHLLSDGQVLLYELELSGGLAPGVQRLNPQLDLLGYDERPDGLLAIAMGWLAGNVSGGLLELWRGSRLEAVLPLPDPAQDGLAGKLGEVVRFSPRGDELAVAAAGAGEPVMLLDVGSLDTLLPPTAHQGFAWSPDGSWFALARDGRIEILDAGRLGIVDVIPVGVTALAWR